MKSPERKNYESPLRRQQQEATRDRIVDAAADLLDEGSPTSMGAVAERAGVSERTVYRHFPTGAELFAAVFASVTSIGEMNEPQSADELADLSFEVFARYERRPEVIRALNGSAMSAETRTQRAGARRRMVQHALADATTGLDEPDRQRLEAAVHVLSSSNAYLHLRDFWDMDAEQSADVVAWAVRALVRAVVTEGGTGNGKRAGVGTTRTRRVGG